MAEKVIEREQPDLGGDLVRELRIAHRNLSVPVLVEHVIRRGEARLGPGGTILAETGRFTGRSPGDKFTVEEASSQNSIAWGKINQPLSEVHFDRLYRRMLDHFRGGEAYVLDAAAAADPGYRLPIRVVTNDAWHSLFSRHIFLRLEPAPLDQPEPGFTVIQAAEVKADPATDGTKSEAFIAIDYSRRLALIGGTAYAGEIKKTIFSVLNYLLPNQGVLSMHCSANQGAEGDVALFFGLSGTGKTSLSSDVERELIGDDEHGWGDQGVFNIEGGCYAKMIRLRQQAEPVIWDAVHHFGNVLENVVFDAETRRVDFDDDRLTENTRGAYPIEHVANYVPGGMGGHPRNIFFLAADATGVLPPISKLDPEQAMYYFLSGYTSKLAGTEKGLGREPQATFSTCFAAPFLPLDPGVYAGLLRQRIDRHRTHVWLLNTGWTSGDFGTGYRISIDHTRAMVRAALSGELGQVPFEQDPFFGLSVPAACPGVPADLLLPRQSWIDKTAYDRQARELAQNFRRNFEAHASQVPDSVRQAGPPA